MDDEAVEILREECHHLISEKERWREMYSEACADAILLREAVKLLRVMSRKIVWSDCDDGGQTRTAVQEFLSSFPQ